MILLASGCRASRRLSAHVDLNVALVGREHAEIADLAGEKEISIRPRDGSAHGGVRVSGRAQVAREAVTRVARHERLALVGHQPTDADDPSPVYPPTFGAVHVVAKSTFRNTL